MVVDYMIPNRFDWALSKVSKEETILDVGCKEGLLTNYANSLGYDIEGMDIDKETIEKARLKYPDLKFHTELPKKKYDAVIACEVLEHTENPTDFLFELSKITNKIILTTPIGLNFDCSEHIQHWMKVDDLIEVIIPVSGSFEIETTYKDGTTLRKNLYGIVIIDKCKKCGKCCYYMKDEKSVPCKYLKEDLCSIYPNRLGTEIDEGITCVKKIRCPYV